MDKINITVKGMKCKHCKLSIEKGLSLINNIENITVDLLNNLVAVSGNGFDINEIKKEINELGFIYDGIAS